MNRLTYLAVLAPFLTRFIALVRFRRQAQELIPEAAAQREEHRSLILAFAGFSFSAVLAMTVVDATLTKSFQDAIFFLLTSFLCFLWALNLQSYKSKIWHGALSWSLIDSGILALILSVLVVIWSGTFSWVYSFGISVFALAIWAGDHLVRVKIELDYVKAKGNGHE